MKINRRRFKIIAPGRYYRMTPRLLYFLRRELMAGEERDGTVGSSTGWNGADGGHLAVRTFMEHIDKCHRTMAKALDDIERGMPLTARARLERFLTKWESGLD